MVHADAANFVGSSKKEAYGHILESTQGLCEGQRNWVCNLANVASLLWYNLRNLGGKSAEINWAGFYVLDPKVENQLILGPFMGKVACQTIAFSRGVCGAAASTGTTQLVPDVHAFPGHIACDGASRSEVVVPVKDGAGRVVAVIDVDSAVEGTFDGEDVEGLEALAGFLGGACDW